jgi:single-stranded DNA-binding protein
MDLNLVVLGGRAAAPPEIRPYDSGSTLLRVLVTVRSDEPDKRRVDVIPVVMWDPPESLLADGAIHPGRRLWIAGSVQRRFWASEVGRRSRLEVVADQICLRDPDPKDES